MNGDGKTIVIRCHNEDAHTHGDSGKENGEGNILLFARGNSIFIKCTYHRCKAWNRITMDIPGMCIDFAKVAYTQKKMPDDYHFDAVKVAKIIEV